MRKFCFRLTRYRSLVVLIGLSHLMTGCDDQSKPSGAQLSVDGQARGQGGAKWNRNNVDDNRTKAQNIKTH